MDRDDLLEAFRLLTEGIGWLQTGSGEPSLPPDFKGGIQRLEEARAILRTYVEETR